MLGCQSVNSNYNQQQVIFINKLDSLNKRYDYYDSLRNSEVDSVKHYLKIRAIDRAQNHIIKVQIYISRCKDVEKQTNLLLNQ